MVGKNPHRPEGKAKADNEHMLSSRTSEAPLSSGPSDKAMHERDMAHVGDPGQYPAEEQFGGSRPGVESRVKEAIARREDRESEE
jgi:hypothetical protein